MIISKTPVRISFFGGGTDYPDYYMHHKGAVMGTTIDKYIYLSINKLSKFFDYKIRVGYSKSELAQTLADIEHPSVRECLKFKNVDGYLDIHIFADLPAKTGLGSSSAFTVGFLNSLYALEGQKVSKMRLAKEACHIEQSLIAENVGSQDQFHAAFGGLNIIEFDSQNINVRPVIISNEKLQYFESNIMIFYTGISRFATEILKEQVENTRQGKKDSDLKKLYQMVFQAEDIISHASKEEMLKEVGNLMDEGWQLKKQLSTQVSNTKIDQLYEKAKSAGAFGGKLCGAGAGGFLLLLVPNEKKEDVRSALPDLLEVECRFDRTGTSILYFRN